MVFSRRSSGPWAIWGAACLCALLVSPAFAQNRIAQEWIVADSLSSTQRDEIQSFVREGCQQLQEGNATQISEARRTLSAPLNNPRGPSDAFLGVYVPQLASCLEKALDSERLITRLNAMIVARRLTTDQALPVIQKGLKDKSAAVRYWAVKASREITESDARSWTDQQQQELLAMLAETLRQEKASEVVQQVMVSIVQLNVPEATAQALEALNRRATTHAASAGQSLDAEHAALLQLYRKLFGAGNTGSAQDATRELARTGYRYMRLVAQQMQEGNVPEEQRASYTRMLELSDAVLHGAYEMLGGTGNVPEKIHIDSPRWNLILAKADRWESILKDSPFNFTAEQLALSASD